MDNYSILNTKVELFKYKGITCIKKEFKPNLDLKISNKLINDFLLEYINDIKSTSINFPKIQKYEILSDTIIYYCTYKGNNLLQKFSYDDIIVGKVDVYLNEVFDIINISQSNNILIDPHLKNFTLSKNKIYYVDFCPPLINKYINHRIDIESEYVNIIRDNFNYFKPENLFYHFCGDLIDAFRGKNMEPIFNKIYKLLCLRNFINKEKFDLFIEKSIRIRKLEDERIDKGLYLF